MREFSKNPNVFEESDSDSDIETDDDRPIAFIQDPVQAPIEDDTDALSMDDDSSDEDYIDESDSDESFQSNKNVQTVTRDQSQPSTSTGITRRNETTTAETLPITDAINEEEDDDDEDDETIKAIRLAIRKPRTSPPEIKTEDFVTDLSFHPDNDIIAIATINGDALIYKYSNEENTLLKKLEVHTKACRSIEFDDEGRNIYTGATDKSIMITDVETEKLKQFYDNAHDSAIYKVYLIDENMFATGDETGTVKLWDNRTDSSIFALKEVEDYISAMLTNDAKKLLLVTSGDGLLTTLNIAARKLFVQSEPYEEELTCMGLYRGDSKVIVGTSKGRLYTYKWGEFGYHSDMFPGVKSPIDCMLPITDKISCLAGEEGVLRATHIAPFKNLGIVGQHSLPIETMDINHSGEFIASSSHNNDVLFWNIKYFEDFTDLKYNVKNNDYKERRHNLPSSKYSNNSDFFADLAN